MKRELTDQERYHLNERIKKEFNFPRHIMESSRVELVDSEFVTVDNQPMWFYFDRDRLAPTIQNLMSYRFLPVVKVSAGATPYIEQGQDIQSAIIKEMDESIQENQLVAVQVEQWDRPIAVGLTLHNAQDIMSKKEGRVIRTLHHVHDKIWQYRHSI